MRKMMLDTPLDRAIVKRNEIEMELKKSPDFQLYLITKSPADRARMDRLLMEIPSFKLWRALTSSIEANLTVEHQTRGSVASSAPNVGGTTLKEFAVEDTVNVFGP
jgi:hypothetical protein